MILRWSIALLICGILVWAISLDFSEPQTSVVSDSKVIDYFIEELEFTSLAPDGGVDYTLYAPIMLHYRNAEEIEFSSPVIQIMGDTGIRWELMSDKGTATIGGEEIYLMHNVSVTDKANKYTPTALKTEHALINQPNQTITSDDPVEIVMGPNILSSTGLFISIDRGIVELNANVKGLYEVPDAQAQTN